MYFFPIFIKKFSREILLIAIVSVVVTFIVQLTSGDSLDPFSLQSWYSNWFDPILTVATFIVAAVVWYGNKRKQWEEDLPKRLTVHFRYGKNYVMSAYNLSLGSEQDIRQFSQQVGAQICGARYLSFIPGVTSYPPVTKTARGEIKVRYYRVEFYLSEIPQELNQQYHIWKFKKVADDIPPLIDLATNDYLMTKNKEIYQRIRSTQTGFPLQPCSFDLKTEL